MKTTIETRKFIEHPREYKRLGRPEDEVFARWNFDRLSASSVAAWISGPALWYLRYIKKYKRNSPAFLRGRAVEAALQIALISKLDVEEAVQRGLAFFDGDVEDQGWSLGQKDVADERSNVRPMIESGFVGVLQIPGKTMEFQREIIVDLGLGIPIVCYPDIITEHGFWDLKTTNRMPSSIETVKRDDVRQVALYGSELNLPGKLAYIGKPPKSGAHEGYKEFPVDRSEWPDLLAEFKHGVRSMRKHLELAETPAGLAEMLCPDLSDYRYDEETREHTREVWGYA